VRALGRIFYTTAFKLSAIYVAVFAAFAISFFVYLSYATNELLSQQVRQTIEAEIRGLAEQGRTGGLPAIIDAITIRSSRPSASLYVIVDANGVIVAGNVSELPAGLLSRSTTEPVTVAYERGGDVDGLAMIEVVRLPGGYRMLVGRDIGEREEFRKIIGRALGWAAALLVLLGLITWVFVSRRVLKRIDSVTATSRRIMAGDLSGRLEVAGNGDEFDRLAASLNTMLDRIEGLLYGLKDVTDNIAHDLKTPLTRLRNRVEAALAGPQEVKLLRGVLAETIEESDQLIRTFNALLMIARIEAGSPEGAMETLDAAEILRDVAELYEPVAEEAGVTLQVEADAPIPVEGSRELLGQALANLIDNAIKYAGGEAGDRPPMVTMRAYGEGGEAVLSVSDNGPGVPAADRERVLQRFVRLEKSRTKPGSGLGLSLVAAVVGLHHGTIVLSDAGPGLVVTIRLPRSGARS
jgi:signal transduction histidine kinase